MHCQGVLTFFMVTYRVSNFLPKLINMLLFSMEKMDFHFLFSLFSGIALVKKAWCVSAKLWFSPCKNLYLLKLHHAESACSACVPYHMLVRNASGMLIDEIELKSISKESIFESNVPSHQNLYKTRMLHLLRAAILDSGCLKRIKSEVPAGWLVSLVWCYLLDSAELRGWGGQFNTGGSYHGQTRQERKKKRIGERER